MKINLLLSLCIPTFNRTEKVLYLLDIIKKQIVGLENDIEVIVSDNHTESDALQPLIDYSQKNDFFTLYLQEKNVGLIGNYHFLIEKATGKYTWIFGDDDVIAEGALKHIIGILRKSEGKIGCLHLSYNHYINSIQNIQPSLYDFGGNYGFITDVDTFLYEYSKKKIVGRFLFMSANMMNSEILKSIIIPQEKRNLCDPIYYSLICSKHGLYIDDYIALFQNATRDSISWKGSEKEVSLYLVPSAIMSIPDSCLSYALKKQIVFNNLRNNLHTLFLLLRMTSQKNLLFLKSLFILSERLRIYAGLVSYLTKKIIYKSIHLPLNKLKSGNL